MKKYIYLVVFILSISQSLSEWREVGAMDIHYFNNPLPATVEWLDIQCLNDNDCFAFGDQEGTVSMITSDGGESWKYSLLDTALYIAKGVPRPRHNAFTMSYPNKNFCIITCDSGYYWISKDNCKTWEKKHIESDGKPVYQSKFFDENFGFITIEGDVYRTKDGTENWEKLNFELPDSLKPDFYGTINLIDKNTIYIPATIFIPESFTFIDFLVKSYDGGDTWEYTEIHEYMALVGLHFHNKDIGLSYNSYYDENDKLRAIFQKTTDAGETWHTVLDTINRYHGSSRTLKFYDDKHGYAVGDLWTLWETNDGGDTWTLNEEYRYDTTEFYIRNFAIINTNEIIGLAGNPHHKIYKYTPGPSSVSSANKNDIQIVLYPNPAHNGSSINLIINSKQHYLAEISITDILGNKIDVDNIQLQAGENHLLYDDNLPSGIYILFVTINGIQYSEKFVVEN